MSQNSAASVAAVPVMPESLGIHAEVVLEGDRRHRLVFGLDLDPFLGLDRLVQAVRPAAPVHHAAGELVDDDDLLVLDDVVGVALEHDVRAQRLVEVVHDERVLDVVEVVGRQHAVGDQLLLDMLDAVFGQADVLALLVGSRRAPWAASSPACRASGRGRLVLGRARDDQRRARLVDQDRIDLVDDREVERRCTCWLRSCFMLSRR
jgi:hypothetical protein